MYTIFVLSNIYKTRRNFLRHFWDIHQLWIPGIMALFNIFNIFNVVNCFTARNSFVAGLIYISSAFCKPVLNGWSLCSLGLTARPLPRVSCFGVAFRLTGGGGYRFRGAWWGIGPLRRLWFFMEERGYSFERGFTFLPWAVQSYGYSLTDHKMLTVKGRRYEAHLPAE